MYRPTKIKKEAKNAYRKNPGVFCPFCGASDSLRWCADKRSYLSKKYDLKTSYECIVCSGKFVEMYKLVNIVSE